MVSAIKKTYDESYKTIQTQMDIHDSKQIEMDDLALEIHGENEANLLMAGIETTQQLPPALQAPAALSTWHAWLRGLAQNATIGAPRQQEAAGMADALKAMATRLDEAISYHTALETELEQQAAQAKEAERQRQLAEAQETARIAAEERTRAEAATAAAAAAEAERFRAETLAEDARNNAEVAAAAEAERIRKEKAGAAITIPAQGDVSSTQAPAPPIPVDGSDEKDAALANAGVALPPARVRRPTPKQEASTDVAMVDCKKRPSGHDDMPDTIEEARSRRPLMPTEGESK